MTYRGLIGIVTGVMFWVTTEDFTKAAYSTIMFNIISTVIFYYHERLWGLIKWDPRKPASK